MGLFSRKNYIEKTDFQSVIDSLNLAFETLREEFFLGSLLQLKREGLDVSGISRDIPPGSMLEDTLKGFQLTVTIGIAWDYIKGIKDQLEFERFLSDSMGVIEGSDAWDFRKRYTDCQGDMDRLEKALAVRI